MFWFMFILGVRRTSDSGYVLTVSSGSFLYCFSNSSKSKSVAFALSFLVAEPSTIGARLGFGGGVAVSFCFPTMRRRRFLSFAIWLAFKYSIGNGPIWPGPRASSASLDALRTPPLEDEADGADEADGPDEADAIGAELMRIVANAEKHDAKAFGCCTRGTDVNIVRRNMLGNDKRENKHQKRLICQRAKPNN